MNFNGKKILFISPRFFNYEVAITDRLRELGATVDFFDERPSNSFLTKGVIRVKPTLFKKKIQNYYKDIQSQIKNKDYDYFLLIKGESIPFSFLTEFKENHPETKRIFYTYDTVDEYPKFKELMSYFDRNISFEPADVKAYSFEFRPLFYLNLYRSENQQKEILYDLVFIGSVHSDRYLIGEKINKLCSDLKLRTFFYYFVPGKSVYYLKRLFDRNLKKFDIKKLSFEKLSHQRISEIYQSGLSVLDINKPFQFGLSMRTFETLASEKKLITTNPEIKKYPFYNPDNILVINRNDISISHDFFKTEFKPLNQTDLYKISIDSWLEDVFLKDKIDYWSIF